jgi:hypothetical protein
MMLVRLVDNPKALLPILMRLGGRVTLVRPVAFQNARASTRVTPLGMSAFPVHELLLVTTLAVTVKVPLVQL